MQNDKEIAKQNVKSDNHGNWTYRFDNLPKYDSKGKAYVYTIQEADVSGYISEVNGYDLVNTETTTVSGRKTWNDNDNHFNTRPESITVKLMRNGEKYAEKNVKADKEGNWTYRFDKLPKYDAEGKAYSYTIQEADVSGYISEVNGYDLVNTETTTVSGRKTWNDNDNHFNTRPESITVKLMRNGEKYAEKNVKADKEGNWTYRFDNLPKYDAEGKAYTYTIQEGKVPDYTTKINGYNLVNTYTGPETPKTPSDPKKPQVPLSPKKPDTSKQSEDDNKNDANHATTEKRLPKTNERSSYEWSILGSILLVTSVGILYRRKHS